MNIDASHDAGEPLAFAPERPNAQPAYLSPGYRSTLKRAPLDPPVHIPQTLSEITGPSRGWERLMGPARADLTAGFRAEPLGERIVVSGRVLDEDGRPVRHTMIEIWQANAAGRYLHKNDQHPAPLDPNFTGAGRVETDSEGRYRFVTIKPGAYPWGNHFNAWRPAHIHYSLFGPGFGTRLITQMYFPGDPLIEIDPIANSVPRAARDRMVSRFDLETTVPETALGYVFDFVLRGRNATPMESPR
jgi:protocatechuate 3,4-dioxygenase beta subunit